MKSKKIFFENLNKSNILITNKFKKKYLDLIKSGNYILSDNVKKFEKNFSQYIGTRYCAGVGNGLDALTISLKSLNLPIDSEVIVASNVYVACVIAIFNANLKPVLVDPDILTYNINPNEIEKKIGRKTKAILAVHLYGKPCDMKSLNKICKDYKLFLIEDCAQSHGASFENKITGSFGDFGCFSFYPTKNLGALGDGGAINCNNKFFDTRVRKFRNYGSIKRYHNEILGCNSRLDELQAAFLDVKLNYLEKINNHKINLAGIYDQNLNNKFIKPIKQKNIKDVYYIYNIRHPERDKLKKFLKKNFIDSDIHYPTPLYKQPCFRGFFKNKFTISDEIHNTTLSLPISVAHKKKDILRVIKILNSF
jgi:dTDP-4-amino-4,6-dideoxygalactose transaminase